jgi:pimeloyl-ACP methyl ester carboxylesterase
MAVQVFPPQGPREIRVGPQRSIRALLWDADVARMGATEFPPIVLLHGLGDSADVWRPLMRRWPRPIDRPIVALDLPGHGQSQPMPQGCYLHSLVAERVAAAIGTLDKPILIGHSCGARIALGLSRKGVDASHMVLLDMGIADTHPLYGAVAAHVRDMVRPAPTRQELVARCATKLPLADPASLAEVIEAQAIQDGMGWRLPTDLSALALLHETTADDDLECLRKLASPLTIIRGAFSAILRRQDLARLRRATDASVAMMEIARAGHALLIEQPKILADVIAGTISPAAEVDCAA